MKYKDIHMVTGAFGYSGSYIASELLNQGKKVCTLTNSVNRKHPLEKEIKAYPFNFDHPKKLELSLKNIDVLYNTYWVRFNHKNFKHNIAVENTKILINAALNADVRKIVHISISNPDKNSHLEYFQAKAELENTIINSGLQYSILRPTVIFGPEDILINNIAYLLRRMPIFAIPGDGQYKLQPIHVTDLSKIAIKEGKSTINKIINAIGPETFTFEELVLLIRNIINKKPYVFYSPPRLSFIFSKILGFLLKDVLLTWPEVEGLMSNLLYVNDKSIATIKLSEWLMDNQTILGKKYHNELERRKNRLQAYNFL